MISIVELCLLNSIINIMSETSPGSHQESELTKEAAVSMFREGMIDASKIFALKDRIPSNIWNASRLREFEERFSGTAKNYDAGKFDALHAEDTPDDPAGMIGDYRESCAALLAAKKHLETYWPQESQIILDILEPAIIKIEKGLEYFRIYLHKFTLPIMEGDLSDEQKRQIDLNKRVFVSEIFDEEQAVREKINPLAKIGHVYYYVNSQGFDYILSDGRRVTKSETLLGRRNPSTGPLG
jgi:hypothetical protein